MDLRDILRDLFDRVGEHVHEAVDGLDPADLLWTPAPGANPIGWLVWHLTRVQDDHVAEILDVEQLWVTGGRAAHFGVSADPGNTGYGHSPTEVAAIRPDSAQVLVDYYEVVASRTDELLDGLTPAGLDRVVDERFDPPVTLGVRLISIADDDIQHGGQACYVRGLLDQR
jgi:DinB family protein